MASKMSAFLRAKHNNHGDPDHQNRTRPRARYVLALCAATLSSVRATKNYDGKQAEIAENRSVPAGIGHRVPTIHLACQARRVWFGFASLEPGLFHSFTHSKRRLVNCLSNDPGQ